MHFFGWLMGTLEYLEWNLSHHTYYYRTGSSISFFPFSPPQQPGVNLVAAQLYLLPPKKLTYPLKISAWKLEDEIFF